MFGIVRQLLGPVSFPRKRNQTPSTPASVVKPESKKPKPKAGPVHTPVNPVNPD